MCICKLLSLLLKILFKFPLGDAEEAKDFVIFFWSGGRVELGIILMEIKFRNYFKGFYFYK